MVIYHVLPFLTKFRMTVVFSAFGMGEGILKQVSLDCAYARWIVNQNLYCIISWCGGFTCGISVMSPEGWDVTPHTARLR